MFDYSNYPRPKVDAKRILDGESTPKVDEDSTLKVDEESTPKMDAKTNSEQTVEEPTDNPIPEEEEVFESEFDRYFRIPRKKDSKPR